MVPHDVVKSGDKKTLEVLGISDVARKLGITRQALWDRHLRGTMPDPDFRSEGLGPLWLRATLKKAGIL